jgi:DnaK suppressor protein
MEEKPSHIDRAYFIKRLQNLRNELLQSERTGDQAAEIVELDQSRVGRLSRMDAMQAQAMAVEARRRRKIQLQRVDAALKRMDRDEFGLCLECGEDIHPKRLEFDPTVLFCIDCAKSKDQ